MPKDNEVQVRDARQELGRSVLGGIVDDDRFDLDISLPPNALQGTTE